MSRRKRRTGAAPAVPGGAEPAERRGRARASSRGLARDLAVAIGVFAVTAAVAELAGAANLGVALGIGQVAFAIALVLLLLRE